MRVHTSGQEASFEKYWPKVFRGGREEGVKIDEAPT